MDGNDLSAPAMLWSRTGRDIITKRNDMAHSTAALQRAFLVCAVCAFFFWPLAANAQFVVPEHIRVPVEVFTGTLSAAACGNLLYQGYRIHAVAWSDIIAKSLLYAGGILFAYEVYIFFSILLLARACACRAIATPLPMTSHRHVSRLKRTDRSNSSISRPRP
jgi:hypothetical protein